VARLKDAPKVLASSPKLGRQVPEYGMEHIRELVSVHPYRIIYAVPEDTDTCTVLAVIHGSRDLANALTPEDLEEREAE
jgi:plasmid stabilization system protein ParE